MELTNWSGKVSQTGAKWCNFLDLVWVLGLVQLVHLSTSVISVVKGWDHHGMDKTNVTIDWRQSCTLCCCLVRGTRLGTHSDGRGQRQSAHLPAGDMRHTDRPQGREGLGMRGEG